MNKVQLFVLPIEGERRYTLSNATRWLAVFRLNGGDVESVGCVSSTKAECVKAAKVAVVDVAAQWADGLYDYHTDEPVEPNPKDFTIEYLKVVASSTDLGVMEEVSQYLRERGNWDFPRGMELLVLSGTPTYMEDYNSEWAANRYLDNLLGIR